MATCPGAISIRQGQHKRRPDQLILARLTTDHRTASWTQSPAHLVTSTWRCCKSLMAHSAQTKILFKIWIANSQHLFCRSIQHIFSTRSPYLALRNAGLLRLLSRILKYFHWSIPIIGGTTRFSQLPYQLIISSKTTSLYIIPAPFYGPYQIAKHYGILLWKDQPFQSQLAIEVNMSSAPDDTC